AQGDRDRPGREADGGAGARPARRAGQILKRPAAGRHGLGYAVGAWRHLVVVEGLRPAVGEVEGGRGETTGGGVAKGGVAVLRHLVDGDRAAVVDVGRLGRDEVFHLGGERGRGATLEKHTAKRFAGVGWEDVGRRQVDLRLAKRERRQGDAGDRVGDRHAVDGPRGEP